jgi:uncharacterized protein (TIGR00255 family)
MIKSMTGFGKAICELPNKKVHIEIKSLNSKQLDLNTRIPAIYREKELELRNELSGSLQRGKVDLTIIVENLLSDRLAQLNTDVIANYYAQLSNITEKLAISGQTDYLRAILSLPDTLKTEQAELDEEEWLEIRKTIVSAIASINKFRIQEGAVLETDISERARIIASLLNEITAFEQQRLDRIKTKIRDGIQELVDKKNIDENRFEQELIYYIEKLDISEEKVRLQNHIEYFFETLQEKEPVGKKLAFITQEMGREINTLGSKANDTDIQRLVIRMKDELEKIKEQSLNIL